MAKIIFGKLTNKKTKECIKVAEIEDKEELSIFPNLNLENAKEFSLKLLLEDDDIFYINLTKDKEIITNYLKILNSSSDAGNIGNNDFSNISTIYIKCTPEKLEDNIINIKFQRIWNKYYFKKTTFISFNSTICELKQDQKLINLTGKTDAYWDGTKKYLYFKKFKDIEPIFKGIEKFYRECTLEDIKQLSNSDMLNVKKDVNFGKSLLKKIAIIIEGKMLVKFDLKKLTEYADSFSQTLKKDEEGKILIQDNKDLKILYNLLSENFYKSEITKEERETNSYHLLNKKTD